MAEEQLQTIALDETIRGGASEVRMFLKRIPYVGLAVGAVDALDGYLEHPNAPTKTRLRDAAGSVVSDVFHSMTLGLLESSPAY